MPMRILIAQFGDYAEAVHHFERGGEETFMAQRYSVDFVAGIARTADVCVLCLARDRPPERLPSGVRALGLELYPPGRRGGRMRELFATLELEAPTHLLLGAALREPIEWALRHGVRVLPLLMDSFGQRGLRAWWRRRRLVDALNSEAVAIVANHNLNASLDLARIGVSPSKIVPFDWPRLIAVDAYAPKGAPTGQEPRVLFAGQVIEGKGVGDAIEAVALLGCSPRPIRLGVAGQGEIERFRERARVLGVEERVEFHGLVSHARVLSLMREHDAVLVPSRREYGEGVPMTLYEGLCTRTPVIASDHPMLRGKLTHGQSGLVFRAGDPADLAQCLRELFADPALYERLSLAAADAAERFPCGIEWSELITRWLRDDPEDRRVLRSWSLASARHTPAATEAAKAG